MQSIEAVREFLEKEIGEDTVVKVYPMLLDIGDEIFQAENTDLLCARLAGMLPESQIKKYANFFATLIFFEKQAEQNGGGEQAELSANCTLRNLSEMTAVFGSK